MRKTTLPSITRARLVRDGGIDAIAALNDALREAIVGLDPRDRDNLKQRFGRVMAEVIEKIINPVIREFPELDPDDATWIAVAKARAAARSTSTWSFASFVLLWQTAPLSEAGGVRELGSLKSQQFHCRSFQSSPF